jgi:ribosomal protein S18 acetylase RimI-like enzyme
MAWSFRQKLDLSIVPSVSHNGVRYLFIECAAMTATVPTIHIRHADSTADLTACFAVMRQLRPQLRDPATLLAAVQRQRPQGYRVLAAWAEGQPVALAGYRPLENLVHGRFLYVDDLVTADTERGHGHGERLLAALSDMGRAQSCRRLVLDTALSNSLAQRFYFRVGLLAAGLHFCKDL